MDPAEFWEYITKAYGLIWFFDGKIMFVYSNSELQTQILKMDVDSIGTLSAIVNRLGFVASDFSFRGVGEANVLIVTAPPQYITVINDITSKFVIILESSEISINKRGFRRFFYAKKESNDVTH